MKLFTLLIAYIFTFSAIAAAPLGVKGRQDTSTQYPPVVSVPNKTATKVSGGTLLETGNNNILQNPSFEALPDPKLGWTAPTSPTLETSDVQNGKQAICYSLSDAPLEVSQDSTINATGFANGTQGMARISVQASSDTTQKIMVCPRRAGAIVSNLCKEVDRDGKWKDIEIPFTLGGTSNGISVHTEGYVNATATRICVDDASVGKEKVTQEVGVISGWTNGTCSGTWTTNTTYSCKYRQVGQDLEVQYLLTLTGAPNATALYLNPPSGFTIDTSKTVASTGNMASFGNGSALDASTNAYYNLSSYIASPTLIGIYYNANAAIPPTGTSSSTNMAEISASLPTVWAVNDKITATIKFPVTQLSSSSTIYPSRNADTDWQTYTPTLANFTVGSGISEGRWKRVGDSMEIRLFTKAGTSPTSTSTGWTWAIPSGYTIDTTKLGTVEYSVVGTASVHNATVNVLEAAVTAVSSTALSVLAGGNYVQSGVPAASWWTQDDSISIIAKVPIVGWSQSNYTIGSFSEVPTTRGSSGADIQSVYFGGNADCSAACTTGNCTICNQVGTKITSVSFSAAGIYNLNGIDGTKYNCSGNAYGSAVRVGVHNRSLSSSSLANLRFFDPVSPTTTGNVGLASVTCIGIP